jgi:hypothetical protein
MNESQQPGWFAMRLPEVASRLRELATDLGCDELNGLADEMGRRSPRQRAPTSSAQMTDALREQIRAIKAAEPELSQAEIGRRLNLNPGRVSEALRGKRA